MNKNSYITEINGKQTIFAHIGVETIPPFEKVTSVSVIPFTKDGNIIAIRLKHRGIDIPGGHVEKYEKTAEETLHREVMEEAYMTIQTPQLIDVIECCYFGPEPGEKSYMLIYTALVDELFEFKLTDEFSYERLIITKEQFINEYDAGDKELMKKMIESAYVLLNL